MDLARRTLDARTSRSHAVVGTPARLKRTFMSYLGEPVVVLALGTGILWLLGKAYYAAYYSTLGVPEGRLALVSAIYLQRGLVLAILFLLFAFSFALFSREKRENILPYIPPGVILIACMAIGSEAATYDSLFGRAQPPGANGPVIGGTIIFGVIALLTLRRKEIYRSNVSKVFVACVALAGAYSGSAIAGYQDAGSLLFAPESGTRVVVTFRDDTPPAMAGIKTLVQVAHVDGYQYFVGFNSTGGYKPIAIAQDEIASMVLIPPYKPIHRERIES